MGHFRPHRRVDRGSPLLMGVKSLLLRRGLTFRTDVGRVQMPARKRSGRPSNIEIGNGARGERKRAPPFGGALFLAHLLDVGGESLRGLAEQAAYMTKRSLGRRSGPRFGISAHKLRCQSSPDVGTVRFRGLPCSIVNGSSSSIEEPVTCLPFTKI